MSIITHEETQRTLELTLDCARREARALPEGALPDGWGLSGLRCESTGSCMLSGSAQQARWEVLSSHLLDEFPHECVIIEGDWYGAQRKLLAVQLVYPHGHARAGEPTAVIEMLSTWQRDPHTHEPSPVAGPLRDRLDALAGDLRVRRIHDVVRKRAERDLPLREDLPGDWVEQMVQALAERDLDGIQYVAGFRRDSDGIEPVMRWTVDPAGPARRHLPVSRWSECGAQLDRDALHAAAVVCGFLEH